MATILVTEKINDAGMKILNESGHKIVTMETRDRAELLEKVKDADAVLVRVLEGIDAEMMDAAPKLKVISKHGVGVDNIDVAAAKARHIPVTVTVGANSMSVAEHSFALMMALAKHMPYMCDGYRTKGWNVKTDMTAVEMTGKTLGIVGCGAIGSKVAKMAAFGFDMKVLVYDPFLKTAPAGCELTEDRDRVFAESDFVTLHCVLDDTTRGTVGAREFALMKDGAIFINCARAGIIDEEALIAALESGHLGGAGLDVTAGEPCPADSPLFKMSNVMLTPHYASNSQEASVNVAVISAQNALDVLAGKKVAGEL